MKLIACGGCPGGAVVSPYSKTQVQFPAERSLHVLPRGFVSSLQVLHLRPEAKWMCVNSERLSFMWLIQSVPWRQLGPVTVATGNDGIFSAKLLVFNRNLRFLSGLEQSQLVPTRTCCWSCLSSRFRLLWWVTGRSLCVWHTLRSVSEKITGCSVFLFDWIELATFPDSDRSSDSAGAR